MRAGTRTKRRVVKRLPRGAAASLFGAAVDGGSTDQELTLLLAERALAEAPTGSTWQEKAVRDQLEHWVAVLRRGLRVKHARLVIIEPFPAHFEKEFE